jgi:hypothetical protein
MTGFGRCMSSISVCSLPRYRLLIFNGHGTVDLELSARSARATEIRITPLSGHVASATAVRLSGRGCEDIEIRVAAGSAQVTEGDCVLTALTTDTRKTDHQSGQADQVRVYYDSAIVEVYATSAAAAAVICNRRGSYGPVSVDLATPFAGRSCAASLTAWSCGPSQPAG